MNATGAPYSIAPEGSTGHEFDLKDLGGSHYVLVGIVGSRDGRSQRFGYDTKVTSEDYDKQFREKLRKLNPPQRVRDFLDHHRAHFEKTGQDVAVFLDHLRYNVLLQMEQQYATSPNTAVARDWHTKTMDNIHKQHRRERNYFLSEAYRIALDHNPAGPLQVNLNPRELGKHLGFDEATTTRIMHDLVDEGLVTSGLGMLMMQIQPKGRRYLEQLHGDDDPRLNPPAVVNNNYNASGGSILQVATNSPSAAQTASVGDQLAESRAFAERVTAKLDEIQQQITAEQFASLKADLEFLKEKLDEPKPRLPLIASLVQGILGGLPSELLALVAGRAFGM